MTTNLHDKMLAAIDAYFSASDGTEAEVAENLLLDVRDEINKQKYVPETNFGNMAEPKIGCVNHDCDQCRGVQEPVGTVKDLFTQAAWEKLDVRGSTKVYLGTPPAVQPAPVQEPDGYVYGNSYWEATNLRITADVKRFGSPRYATPPAPQPVPVKTCHDGKPWPVAPKPWVGLSEEEVMQTMSGDWTSQFYFARAIEAKLKEKNT